ncbi:hypothetical protein [Adhaeribacter aquaticus]|uniref:hypothetical protein n=1 Tax=Adhaeribacter aquaticus TaxID=299567 RepID=UPI000409CB98|nr:hypothetical protein [Adhaeribacter aquaticus]
MKEQQVKKAGRQFDKHINDAFQFWKRGEELLAGQTSARKIQIENSAGYKKLVELTSKAEKRAEAVLAQFTEAEAKYIFENLSGSAGDLCSTFKEWTENITFSKPQRQLVFNQVLRKKVQDNERKATERLIKLHEAIGAQ